MFHYHTNLRKNIRVTFFDQLAEEFEKQVKLFKGHEPSIIISCAKVNEYEGICIKSSTFNYFLSCLDVIIHH